MPDGSHAGLPIEVSRENGERAAAKRGDRAERALIEAHESRGAVSVSENDQRGISQVDAEIAMLFDQPSRHAELLASQTLDLERPSSQILDECQLDIDAKALEDQVVGLGHSQL